MSPFVVITVLVLHLTGLWSNLSAPTKAKLSDAAVKPVPAVSVPDISLPVPIPNQSQLSFSPSMSVYAVDPGTGQTLYASNASLPRPIASVTKLMTVMVALSKLKPQTIVTVGTLPTYDVADETLGLVPGEKISVENLVKAALIPSDNDAADALAIATSGSLTKFYAAMNAKAAEWGITGAHFVSASGLVDTGNLVSAVAIAKIATLDLANPLIKSLVNVQATTISDLAGRSWNLTTTDDLLATGHFYGIKTGYTAAAGECFVGLTKINGHQIITVVLGADDRFGTTQTLVNWIGNNWTWL